MTRRAPYILAALTTLMVLAVGATAAGQTITAELKGTVTDVTGGVLPNATVVAVGPTGQRETVSDVEGFYRLSYLAPGLYQVTVSQVGFQPAVREVTLPLHRTLTLDVQLEVGQAEQVTVRANAPATDRSRSSLSSVISPETIELIPVNNRNYLDLIRLTPGVVENPRAGATASTALDTTGAILGERAGNISFLTDGLWNNDSFNGGVLQNLTQDTVEQFEVIAAGYAAEFGQGSGGVVNVITKSGTNQVSGSGFTFIRNDALDASNVDGDDPPELARFNVGFTVGECERNLVGNCSGSKPCGLMTFEKTDISPREKGAEMSSVLRSVRKRKKGHTLGAVDVIDRAEYAELEVDAKVALIRSLVPLGLMHIEELLDEEVTALAGERSARKAPSVGGRRHGSNPGTVGLAGQRVPIRVPRIRHVTEREIPLRSYEALHGDRAVNDLLLRRVLYGISCRNYAAAAEAIPRAIGLSGSTVSRAFIQASATKLRELQERDLSGEDVVALVLDGKTFAEATMVVALGITMTGDKRFLGVVETNTENEKVLTPFLRSLVERGLDVSQGLLVIVDGGKGLRAAVRKAFRHRALVQRCQWHTRENVVRDVAKREQPVWRQRLQRAYHRPEYDEALAALQSLQHELEDRNQSAAGSLAEGLDETLTLHRLGVYGVLGRSLKTTNGLESINALIEERCAKVDHWQNSSQRHRWLATALLDIEPRLRKVMGYRHLPRLRDALKRELKIDTTTSTKKAA